MILRKLRLRGKNAFLIKKRAVSFKHVKLVLNYQWLITHAVGGNLARASVDRDKRIVNKLGDRISTKAWNDGMYTKSLFSKTCRGNTLQTHVFLKRGSCQTAKPDLVTAFSYVRFLHNTLWEISNTQSIVCTLGFELFEIKMEVVYYTAASQ